MYKAYGLASWVEVKCRQIAASLPLGLKDLGWDNYVMDNREWKSGVMPASAKVNGIYVEKRR